MNDEELKDLIAPAVEVEAPSPDAEPTVDVEEAGETPALHRTPDGKFAKADPPEPPAQAPLTEKETVGFYKAMQEERDKRQAAERRIAELTARAEPAEPPDPTSELQMALYGQKLGVSRKFAEREYGKDAMAAVHDWASAKCDADPAFNTMMRSSDDPYEDAMQAFNRERVLKEVGPGELDEFKAWKAAKADPAQQTPPPPQSTPQPPVPRSLATAPGNGAAGKAHVPVGEGLAFASIIKG